MKYYNKQRRPTGYMAYDLYVHFETKIHVTHFKAIFISLQWFWN